MDKNYEEIVVKTFFKKEVQARIIFELASSKKRRDALSRLCHNFEKVLDERFMFEIPRPNSEYLNTLTLLKKHGAKDPCYVISFNERIDGKYLPLEEALKETVGYGLASIISCIPNELAYFESEQSFGAPPRFVLKRQ